ncbi:MAG: DUF3843 family protein [Bacteroidales bacterium]|nr:DUF3843 family protein [Bacteroidales bacterium]
MARGRGKSRTGRKSSRKVIFPKDWVGARPYDKAGEADVYYSSIANEVYSILRFSPAFDEVIHTEDRAKQAAIVLTSQFEDIISGLGMWDLVVGESLRRYGRLLPFYDTSDYVRGEINLQDVCLLLWDVLQSFRKDTVSNPENPCLHSIATEIFSVFDSEYEYAIENVPLKEFLSSPEISSGYWKVRYRLEWILQSSYLCHRFLLELGDELDDLKSSKGAENMTMEDMAYHHEVDSLFNFRSNLLSMRCPEILSGICGCDSGGKIGKMRIVPVLSYLYLGKDDSALLVKRLADGEKFRIELDSFSSLDTSRMKVGKTILAFSIVNYGDKWYQCGIMSEYPENAVYPEYRRMMEREVLSRKLPEKVVKKILRKFGGRNWEIFPTARDVIFFFEDYLGERIEESDFGKEDLLRPYLVCLDSSSPWVSYPDVCPCICAPDNPFYDKAFAEKNGLSFFVDPDTCPYETSVSLVEEGFLPDAGINSISGAEHGRKYLHEHAHFFLDYFFHRYKGDGE